MKLAAEKVPKKNGGLKTTAGVDPRKGSPMARTTGNILPSLAVLLFCAILGTSQAQVSPTPSPPKAGFQRRGFYLHGSWVMEHPFAVRKWSRQDFAKMFRLMRHLGFNTVMWWPTPEVAPMPLSEDDAKVLRTFRNVVDDAHKAGLECWLAYCPSVISKEEVRSVPWPERSLYASMQTLRLTDENTAKAYLGHRRKVLKLLDNADAFVVIDGDPGGYPGAPVDEYVRILRNDQQAVPAKRVIPCIWNGWGRDNKKGGFWTQPVAPHSAASLAALKRALSEPWELLPGRSHRDGWANGRVNIEVAEQAGLIPRSTLLCYEAIEFEPTPPAAVLQFDLIRKVLKEEGKFAGRALGVMGNAQQPVMVLPNLYYFARGAADLSYLEKPQDDVLAELARELGGDPAVLIPAWACLQYPLAKLPADLADRVRSLKLSTDMANDIPGGPCRYLEILAAQVESRRQLLEATSSHPADAIEASACLAKGAVALVKWWQVHRYVGSGRSGDPFRWAFIHPSQVAILKRYAKQWVSAYPGVAKLAAHRIGALGALSQDEAAKRLHELIAGAP